MKSLQELQLSQLREDIKLNDAQLKACRTSLTLIDPIMSAGQYQVMQRNIDHYFAISKKLSAELIQLIPVVIEIKTKKYQKVSEAARLTLNPADRPVLQQQQLQLEDDIMELTAELENLNG